MRAQVPARGRGKAVESASSIRDRTVNQNHERVAVSLSMAAKSWVLNGSQVSAGRAIGLATRCCIESGFSSRRKTWYLQHDGDALDRCKSAVGDTAGHKPVAAGPLSVCDVRAVGGGVAGCRQSLRDEMLPQSRLLLQKEAIHRTRRLESGRLPRRVPGRAGQCGAVGRPDRRTRECAMEPRPRRKGGAPGFGGLLKPDRRTDVATSTPSLRKPFSPYRLAGLPSPA